MPRFNRKIMSITKKIESNQRRIESLLKQNDEYFIKVADLAKAEKEAKEQLND